MYIVSLPLTAVIIIHNSFQLYIYPVINAQHTFNTYIYFHAWISNYQFHAFLPVQAIDFQLWHVILNVLRQMIEKLYTFHLIYRNVEKLDFSVSGSSQCLCWKSQGLSNYLLENCSYIYCMYKTFSGENLTRSYDASIKHCLK